MASGNITGKVNVGLFKYEGVNTDTAETVVNNEDRTISVNVNTEVIATKEDLDKKQDKLTAGSCINISEENVISAEISDVSWGNISGNIANQTDLQNEFESIHSSIQDIEDLIPEEASLQNKLADKELVSSALSSANSYTDNVITTVKRNAYRDVNTTTYPTLENFLASTGEEGFMYLYPIDTTDLSKGYKQYIWENSSWRFMGNTSLSLDGYAKLDEDNTWSGSNYFSKLSGIVPVNSSILFKGSNVNFVARSNYLDVISSGSNCFRFGVSVNNTGMNQSAKNFCPVSDGGQSLGAIASGGFNYRWKDLYLTNAIKNNNSNYGISIPDMSEWTANKTVATTSDLESKQDKIIATSADAGKVVSVDSNGNLTLTTPSGGSKLYLHKIYLPASVNYLYITTTISTKMSTTEIKQNWSVGKIMSGVYNDGSVVNLWLAQTTLKIEFYSLSDSRIMVTDIQASQIDTDYTITEL